MNKKDYNRNIFTVRTDDQLAEKIRTYCKDNNVCKKRGQRRRRDIGCRR